MNENRKPMITVYVAPLIKKKRTSIPLENWAKVMSKKFTRVIIAATTISVLLLSARQIVRHCRQQTLL